MNSIISSLLLFILIFPAGCSNKKVESLELMNKTLQQQNEFLTKQMEMERRMADSTVYLASKKIDELKLQLDSCQKHNR